MVCIIGPEGAASILCSPALDLDIAPHPILARTQRLTRSVRSSGSAWDWDASPSEAKGSRWSQPYPWPAASPAASGEAAETVTTVAAASAPSSGRSKGMYGLDPCV